jgi:Zn-dependent protease with chaperone function
MRRLAWMLLTVLAAGCSTSGEEIEADEAAHTAKDPVHGNAPFYWAETDYATFRGVAQWAPFRTGTPLDGREAASQRLQAWADRIDAEVRKDVLRRTGQALVAPKPVLVIVPAKEANAWVSGIPVCFTGEADLRALGAPGRPAKVANLAFVKFEGIFPAFSFFGGPPPKCAAASNWANVDDAIAFVNASGTKCRIEKTGDRVKVTGADCQLEGSDAPTSAKQLTFYASSPYIHFTSAMVALAKDERGLAGIVAHELGHYYRAHAVSDVVMGRYNHWYEQKDPPDPVRPAPSADSPELETRFKRVMAIPMARVPGQRLSYRITGMVSDELGRLLEAANGAGFPCADAVTKLGEWTSDFSAFGGAHVSRETQASYLAYEEALLACAPQVRVTAAGGANALKLEDVRTAIRYGADDFAEPAVAAGTLAEILQTIHDRASVLDRDADGFFEVLKTRRIGRWTAEQEADDFSLEYFTRSGVAAKVRIDTYLELIEAHAAEDPARFPGRNDGLDLAACKAMARTEFRDAAGRAVFVPLGNLHDPHHGDCYRLFNMSQEQRAHRFRASGGAPSFQEPWEQIRAAAQRATDDFRPSGPGPSHMPQHGPVLPKGGTIVDGI